LHEMLARAGFPVPAKIAKKLPRQAAAAGKAVQSYRAPGENVLQLVPQTPKKKRRGGSGEKPSNHAHAFVDLEPDICDLERAAELCLRMVEDDDFESTFFTIRQLVPMARALRKKYYKLY